MKIFEKSIKEKIEDAKKNPAGIFSLSYLYILVIGLAVGLLYVDKFNVPPKIPEANTTEQDLKVQEAKTIPPVDVMKMKNPSQELTSKGKTLFTANCSSCHGEDGKGNGPASAGLNPPPRDYTSNEGWKNGQKLSGIFKTLQEGITGSAMASYSYMNPEDLFALAQYIRSEFIKNPPDDTDADLNTLDDTYNLSQGKQQLAQIPVKYAEEIIINENKPKYQKITSALNSINNDRSSEGSLLFDKITTDKFQALTVLNNSSGWKGDQQKFINVIVTEAKQGQFNGNVYYLTNNEWNTLFNYLNKYL